MFNSLSLPCFLMIVRNSEEIPKEPVDRSKDTYIQWLISSKDGAPNFVMRKFILYPGGRIPAHFHKDIEHEQYVLKGSYTLILDKKKYTVKKGDAIFIPPGATHEYINDSTEEAEFLCIIPAKEKYNTIWLEDE